MSEPGAPGVEIVPNGGWDRRVRVFRRGSLVDIFAIVTERYVVVIDTLDTPAAAEQLLDGVRDDLAAGRLLLVVNTHADWDHAWGNAVFAGPDARWPAPIIGHARCRERLLADEAEADLRDMRSREPERFGPVRLVPPTLTIEAETLIHGGDLTLVLLPTPGHQPDHLAVWLPEIRLLIAADSAEAPFPSIGGPEGVAPLRDSLARLRRLDPALVLACHAQGSTAPALLEDNLSYLDELERRCRVALATGAPWRDEATDLERLIDYPAEVAASAALPAKQADYYRSTHSDAIRAMLGALDGR